MIIFLKLLLHFINYSKYNKQRFFIRRNTCQGIFELIKTKKKILSQLICLCNLTINIYKITHFVVISFKDRKLELITLFLCMY